MTNSETYLDADGNLMPVPVLDHDQTGVAPGYRIVQLADGWIAIAATTAAHAAAVCSVAGVSELAQVPDAIRERKTDEILASLDAAGVPCELVRENQSEGFFTSEANTAAGLVARYQHLHYGTVEQPGAFWALGDLDVRLDKAPPALGEHSIEILEQLGFARVDIDGLIASGVVAAA
jgi:crotonobetainyl-CoA:carnitine CoA-transferase CaiB-like acyl-CoA transferase